MNMKHLVFLNYIAVKIFWIPSSFLLFLCVFTYVVTKSKKGKNNCIDQSGKYYKAISRALGEHKSIMRHIMYE